MKFPDIVLAITVFAATFAQAEQPISAAEQHLFMDHHFSQASEVSGLSYRFVRRGSLDEAFEDAVTVTLGSPLPEDRRQTEVHFLSGARTFNLPEAEPVTGNPVILSFLERDVREMQRHTKGQANYFRKRVRMALAEKATVENVHIDLDGRQVPAWRISITPYLDDPLRIRFERLAGKTYQFLLSNEIPGAVWEMRSTVLDAKGAPLVEEVLTFAQAKR